MAHFERLLSWATRQPTSACSAAISALCTSPALQFHEAIVRQSKGKGVFFSLVLAVIPEELPEPREACSVNHMYTGAWGDCSMIFYMCIDTSAVTEIQSPSDKQVAAAHALHKVCKVCVRKGALPKTSSGSEMPSTPTVMWGLSMVSCTAGSRFWSPSLLSVTHCLDGVDGQPHCLTRCLVCLCHAHHLQHYDSPASSKGEGVWML